MANKFTELQINLAQSSQLIGHQLQSIDSSLLSAFLAIIVTIALSNFLGPLIYWIPASFCLMWILSAFSLITQTIKILCASIRQIIQIKRKTELKEPPDEVQPKSPPYNRNTLPFMLGISLKNSAPLFKALGIIFLVSFAVLVFIVIGKSEEVKSLPNIAIPIASSLLFLFLPILVNIAIGILEKTKALDFTKLGCLSIFLILLLATLTIPTIFLVLPILSLINILPIFINEWINILPILLVVLLQMITGLIFWNYFSASSVKKEMTIAILNLSKTHNQITDLLLNNTTISDNTYNELKESYLKAKRYEVYVDDSLLVNIYSLIPNTTYLSVLSEGK